jgi:transportin-3
MQLEESYHQTVALEDIDKTMNLCRVFTVMAETFLPKMVSQSTHTQPHFSIKCLDLLLNCVGHYDFEVAQITFNVWYKLSEELYHKNDTILTKHFKPYVERLIEALYKHSQMDADHEGLLEDGDGFQVCFYGQFFILRNQENSKFLSVLL